MITVTDTIDPSEIRQCDYNSSTNRVGCDCYSYNGKFSYCERTGHEVKRFQFCEYGIPVPQKNDSTNPDKRLFSKTEKVQLELWGAVTQALNSEFFSPITCISDTNNVEYEFSTHPYQGVSHNRYKTQMGTLEVSTQTGTEAA